MSPPTTTANPHPLHRRRQSTSSSYPSSPASPTLPFNVSSSLPYATGGRAQQQQYQHYQQQHNSREATAGWATGNSGSRRKRRNFIMTLLPGLAGRYTLATIFLFSVAAYLFRPNIYELGERIRQTHPWSFQREVEQTFTPTDVELACLRGGSSNSSPSTIPSSSPSSSASSASIEPIPNIVHFIFGLRNPLTHPGAGHFDFLCYLALRSAIVSLRPTAVYLHYTYLSSPPSADYRADPASNPWIRRLKENVTLVNHPPEEFTKPPYHTSTNWHAAHVSDILRLQLLRDQGGIYLDIDAFALRSFDAILKSPKDVILGHEGGNRWGLCNAIMVARPDSSFVKRWIESYKDADMTKEWNYHSVLLPKEMEQEHPGEVCTLPPTSFFWPTWTWRHIGWMHDTLNKKEAETWGREIERTGGSLFDDQIAYHAWNQMAYERYMKYLTPKIMRTRNTRFNMLMRRFIEDDIL